MSTANEQKLVDIAFALAITAAEYMHGRSKEDVAAWAAEQLRECGFDTHPAGMSWGVLAR